MLEGMYAAANGMDAQQQQLDAIGNDLANASTTGYKSERVGFRDLLYNEIEMAGTKTTAGAGAAAAADRSQPVSGRHPEHRRPARPRHRRRRLFHRQARGWQYRADPRRLFRARRDRPACDRRRKHRAAADHGAEGHLPGRSGDRSRRHGKRRYEEARQDRARQRRCPGQAAGRRQQPVLRQPPRAALQGRPPARRIHQGALESSNVDVATEMVQMVTTQRSYQLESSAIQTENQMLSIANELRS